ncbi:MAG: GldG family protein [Kiritimatiellae bacterium]|nr:GldG family protein [Kiritimatiellia bacterium]
MALRAAAERQREMRRRIWRMRRIKFGAVASLTTSLALSLVAAGFAHALAMRRFVRADLSRGRVNALTDVSRHLVASLTNTVDITVLLRGGRELADVTRLLAEYQAASRAIRVRRLDPDRDIAAVNELARRLPIAPAGCIVVQAGDRVRIIEPDALYELERRPSRAGIETVPRAFRGEPAISSAIHEVTRTRPPVVYALAGHGERAVDDLERFRGLASAARRLQQDGIEVRPLLLSEDSGVPADAGALWIAGPRSRLPQPVLDALNGWLERGGRALILLDSGVQTGLEGWLRRWGLEIGDDRVVDETRTLGGGLLVSRFVRHGATARLRDLACVFYQPRSVEPAADTATPAGGADRPRAVRLALTSDRGWAERDYLTPPWSFDEMRDRAGPVAVAAAVERGAPGALAAGIRPARLVVVGDSGFVANGAIVSGNGDFLLGAMNWLLDRRERLDIPARPIDPPRLAITRAGLRWLGAGVMLVVPGSVMLVGLAVAWRRRS